MGEIVSQPVYKRQRFLLDFIRQMDGNVESTDLQQLVFEHNRSNDSSHYDFVSYAFGAYSFRLREDLDILKRDGYIDIKHKDQKLLRVKNMINTQAEQVLFTIGYEGRSVETFINTLVEHDVRLLCDVRKNPLSRKFGFSKGKLEQITQTVGIQYVNIPSLGIDSAKRGSLKTTEDYYRLFEDYTESLMTRKPHLDEVHGLIQTHSRVALMCFEREACMCHRHVIRDYITDSFHIKSVDI